jgi:two-component system, NtrC family, sensor histidine kinase PilS
MHSTFDEKSWLAWLVKVRVIILTCLLGVELTILRLAPSPIPVRPFISSMLLWYALSAFFVLLLSVWEERRMQAKLQVLTDLAMVTLVVHVTGGVDSSLNFLYPLVVIVACILLPRRWAFVTAGLAFVLYGAVVELAYYEIIPSYYQSRLELKSLQAILVLNLLSYLGVAYLATQLVGKLRQADVQLKDASGALQSLQALHEDIIRSMTGGLITTDQDGRTTLTNGAAQKLLDRTEMELLHASVQDLFLDKLPLLSSEDTIGEIRCITSKGLRKTFRIRASLLTTGDGGSPGYVFNLDDLTEIRRLERDLRLRDRLAAVGRLSAAIAHEIRNPLTSIAGSAHMLKDTPSLSEEQRQLLDIVTRESDRLNAIITDFLDYSRGRQYRFERTDLIPLLEDTLTLLENRLRNEKSAIQLTRDYHTEQALAVVDGDRLKQVFWNFCENAVRAMREGGTLTVSLERMGDEWQINFADTGPGMTPQQTEKIFEPFQSAFPGGTGLGLAIVYEIVQAHDGKVWARSRPGQGTTFVLRVRRMEEEGIAISETGSATRDSGEKPVAAVVTAGGGLHG